MIVLVYVFVGGFAACLFLMNLYVAIVPQDWATAVCVAPLVAGAIHLAIAFLLSKDRRVEDLRRLAAARGWSFRPTESWTWHRRYGDLDIFFRGRSRAIRNLMKTELRINTHTLPVEMGDYAYTVGWGRSSKRYRLSFLAVRLPTALPSILLRPERFSDRVFSAAGFNDIDFESKAFSDRYMVGSYDKKFAFRLISPLVMQFLMEKTEINGLPSFSISSGWLGISGVDEYWSTGRFEEALAWIQRFIELWPNEFLDPQYGRAP